VAANLFADGQETTVRLLSSAVKIIAEQAEIQKLLRRERDRIPNLIEETLRLESPVKGDFRLARRAVTVGDVITMFSADSHRTSWLFLCWSGPARGHGQWFAGLNGGMRAGGSPLDLP